jgi:hypothetical protein
MNKRNKAKYFIKNGCCGGIWSCETCFLPHNCANLYGEQDVLVLAKQYLQDHPKKSKGLPGQMIEDICAIAKESVDWPPTQGQRIHEVLYKYGYKIDRLNNERNT